MSSPLHLCSKEPPQEEKHVPKTANASPIRQNQGGTLRKVAYLLTFVAGAAGMYAVENGPLPFKRPPLLAPERKETSDQLRIPGVTEATPGRLAKITLATNQAIASVDVNVGDRVKKGWQVFSHFASPEGLEAMKKEILRTEHALTAATERSDAAHHTLARLRRAQSAVSAQELEDAHALASVRAAELAAANVARDMAVLRFAEADFHFQQAFVQSPIDGTVVEVSVTPGERRQIGGPFRGVVVLDQRTLSVRCPVTPAQQKILQCMSGGDLTALHATVDVDGTTYPATVRSFGLLELLNPREEIPCGIPVRVTFSPKK
ncbi:efflux RND transporter periplasmic adaptor subunit [Candidatus Peregrinibacteria bacterium]|nr:efflux RND transporter periplasmic adaptor subunit [Candidatus Peregrinibacteria bacterium]MBI2523618.1 efflux RND transporter periplasmic adaptor subunit [Candidatus Peregrinibacteria bacterium]